MKHKVYWRDTEEVQYRPALEQDTKCDVCVVGAGYTGLWTAYFLHQADPSLDIVIAEAEFAGAGASSHNDGFVFRGFGGHNLASLSRKFGSEAAEQSRAALNRSALELARFCVRSEFNAEFEASGLFVVATTSYQRKRLLESLREANASGAGDAEVFQGDAMLARIGSPAILAGCWEGGGLLNPHKLVRGLARTISAAGVTIYERTPITAVDEAADAVTVTAASGASITAGRVVLATDAYQQWHPAFRRQLQAHLSYALVTAPLTRAQLASLSWPGRQGFIDGGRPGVFGRLTWDNRLLLGGGFAQLRSPSAVASELPVSPRSERRMIELLGRYFPALRTGPESTDVEYVYGGVVGVTRDELPHVGQLSPKVGYGYGYSGHGIVPCHLAGKALRDIVLDQHSADRALVFVGGAEPEFEIRPVSTIRLQGRRQLRKAQDWLNDRF